MENGIDLKVPASIGPLRAKGAVELGVPEGMPLGLYVGQHILEKNLEFLVRSLPRIMEAVPDFRMAFVGQGYAKPQLQELVSELGIADKVIFHPVVYDREVLSSIYARADLFLFPSLYDNAPLVVREAAAFRTPAILLRGSTAATVIEDGANGFLAENDQEAFSQRAIKVLSDSRALENAGFGAQRTLCRSWEDVVHAVRDRYLEILSRWAH
jgi:glycosyltransferase involved in cell wall biosynthesis